MRNFLVISFLLVFSNNWSQTLTGTWQVVKETNCLQGELEEQSETEADLVKNISSLSGAAPKTIRFNTDGTGEENWRSRGKKKPTAKDKFLYRLTGGAVYFLDKKTRLITGTYMIESFSPTSIIMFNKDRTCERVELVRVN